MDYLPIKPISFNSSFSTFGKMAGGKFQEFATETEYREILEEESEFQKILEKRKEGLNESAGQFNN